jgi:hypothetical protein
MNKFVNVSFVIVLVTICSACKQYKEIEVEASNGEIAFLLPPLPKLGTLYVEQLNTEKDAFQMAWSVSFVSSAAEPRITERIVYGRVPPEAKLDVMSEPKALKADVLYTVAMDVGPIVAKGLFIIQKSGTEMAVRNLTYQEADEFRKASRHRTTSPN